MRAELGLLSALAVACAEPGSLRITVDPLGGAFERVELTIGSGDHTTVCDVAKTGGTCAFEEPDLGWDGRGPFTFVLYGEAGTPAKVEAKGFVGASARATGTLEDVLPAAGESKSLTVRLTGAGCVAELPGVGSNGLGTAAPLIDPLFYAHSGAHLRVFSLNFAAAGCTFATTADASLDCPVELGDAGVLPLGPGAFLAHARCGNALTGRTFPANQPLVAARSRSPTLSSFVPLGGSSLAAISSAPDRSDFAVFTMPRGTLTETEIPDFSPAIAAPIAWAPPGANRDPLAIAVGLGNRIAIYDGAVEVVSGPPAGDWRSVGRPLIQPDLRNPDGLVVWTLARGPTPTSFALRGQRVDRAARTVVDQIVPLPPIAGVEVVPPFVGPVRAGQGDRPAIALALGGQLFVYDPTMARLAPGVALPAPLATPQVEARDLDRMPGDELLLFGRDGAEIHGIRLDGGILPGFPMAVAGEGPLWAEGIFVRSTPAVMRIRGVRLEVSTLSP